MGNPQKVKFHSLEEFFDFLPKEQLKVTEFLRDLVFDSLTNPSEKLSYNVPFYSIHSRLCFIWPSAVPWGNVKKKGIEFGFCQGFLMNDPLDFLDRGKRKQVYTKTFFNIDEIDVDVMRTYLHEAERVDLEQSKAK